VDSFELVEEGAGTGDFDGVVAEFFGNETFDVTDVCGGMRMV